MYSIYASNIYNNPVLDDTGEVIDISTNAEYKLIFTDRPALNFVNAYKPKLVVEDNSAGHLTFTLPYNHEAREFVKLRRSFLYVVSDENIMYRDESVPKEYDLVDSVYLKAKKTYTIPSVIWKPDTTKTIVKVHLECDFSDDLSLSYFGIDGEFNVHLSKNPESGGQEKYLMYLGHLRYLYRGYTPVVEVLRDDQIVPDWRVASEVEGPLSADGMSKFRDQYFNGKWYWGVDSTALKTNTIDLSVSTDKVYIGDKYLNLNSWYEPNGEITKDFIFHTSNTDNIKVKSIEVYYGDELSDRYIPVILKSDGSAYLWNTIKDFGLPIEISKPGSIFSRGEKIVKPFWCGRPVSSSVDFNKSITYECAGLLDCFGDHIIRSIEPNNY